MSIVVEELEILVKANLTDALEKLPTLREQIQKTLSATLPDLQKQLQPAKQILDQYGNAFTTGAQKAQEAVKQTGDRLSRPRRRRSRPSTR